MKKILCPTDFSEAAHNAVAYAAKFAQQTGAELVLFNVQSMFALSPGELLSPNPESVERTRATLESQAMEVTGAFDISCYGDLQVSDESLSHVITEHAEDFDLIIMGTNGPDDLYQFFFGTNTYHVLRKAGVPLILVPDTVRFSFIKRMVFAYDYTHLGKPPLNQFNNWMKHFDSEVVFLQLSQRPLNEDEKVLLARHKLEIEYDLEEDFEVKFDRITTTEYPETIQHYLLTSDAEMLVLCAHTYSIAEKLFHKSLAKQISMDFMYPVMVVHE